MAAVAGDFTKGDCVWMWSDESQSMDQEGVVGEVLEAPRAVDGDIELPVGSVQVVPSNGKPATWIRADEVASKLRKAVPSDDGIGWAETSDDPAITTSEEEALRGGAAPGSDEQAQTDDCNESGKVPGDVSKPCGESDEAEHDATAAGQPDTLKKESSNADAETIFGSEEDPSTGTQEEVDDAVPDAEALPNAVPASRPGMAQKDSFHSDDKDKSDTKVSDAPDVVKQAGSDEQSPPDVLKAGDKFMVREEFDATGALVGSWLGSAAALGARKVEKGTQGAVEEITKEGSAVVRFVEAWDSWRLFTIPPAKWSCLTLQDPERKPAPLNNPPSLWSKQLMDSGLVKGLVSKTSDKADAAPTDDKPPSAPAASQAAGPDTDADGSVPQPHASTATPTKLTIPVPSGHAPQQQSPRDSEGSDDEEGESSEEEEDVSTRLGAAFSQAANSAAAAWTTWASSLAAQVDDLTSPMAKKRDPKDETDSGAKPTTTSSGRSLLAPPSAARGRLQVPGSPSPSNRSPSNRSDRSCSPRAPLEPLRSEPYDRAQQRVLVIGSGFGMELNPVQFQLVLGAGFQVHAVTALPNPESPSFPVHQYLPTIKQAIDDFQPHVVACASKGGAYMVALWQTRLWAGPSLLINKHPALLSLPQGVPVILCHGSNDEVYQYKREDLEALIRTGTRNRCFLYYTANSGLLNGRAYTREGDRHNMASILQYDCLPRLLDAAMSGGDPELHLMRSWDGMVTSERREAEQWLGHSPCDLPQFWQSADQEGMDENVLFQVVPGTEEFAKVEAIFRAQPAVPRAYTDMSPGMWQQLTVSNIERVENGMQLEGNAEPYYKLLQRGIENQGLEFVPGLHTKWLFHGSSAVEEIASNPTCGFQPLMSGTRGAALWGPGTYFARDAKYVYDGGFCKTLPSGEKQILLCLVMAGMPCLGCPNHRGVLPIRHGRHRYNTSVDSISNPEIFVTQNPGAAYPAYVVTFAPEASA